MIVKAKERMKEDQTWVDCEVKQKTGHRKEDVQGKRVEKRGDAGRNGTVIRINVV